MKRILLWMGLFEFLSPNVGVNLNAATIYSVGASGDYSTIASAYAVCTGSTDYLIEIQSDYVTESLPINLGALANKSSINTVTIRPKIGVTNLAVSGTAAQIFYFNGADFVILDGRPGGSGAGDFNISNTSTSASRRAIEFGGSATNNQIQYCTIKGSNASTTITTAGIIYFGNTNNDNNTITNCSISNASGGNPAFCIVSSGATAPNENNNNTLSANSIYNFTRTAIEINSNNYVWSITANSLYQTSAITPSSKMNVIEITSGYGYSISGNYIGGQAVNCGGSAFTLSSSLNTAFTGIYLGVTATSPNTIYGNTIQNITVTSTTTSFRTFVFVETYASSVTIGSSGNGNTFGSSSGTGSITITDNSSGNTNFPLCGILFGGTNANSESCSYNTFGSITIAGTNTGNGTNHVVLIDNAKSNAAGALSVSYNTIGNSSSNNINITMNDDVALVTNHNAGTGNTSVFTINNNVFQNIRHTSTSLRFQAIFSDNSNAFAGTNPSSITYNTFTNISTASSDLNKIIVHAKTGGSTMATTISNNTISNLTLSSTGASDFTCIFVIDNISTTVCHSNTIGSSVTNNISYAGSSAFYGISYQGSSTLTANSNLIQNVNLTGTGNSVRFNGIHGLSGIVNLTSDTIQNITSATTSVTAWHFSGILLSSATNGQSTTECAVKNLISTTTGASAIRLYGIYGDGNGSGSIKKCHISGLKISSTSSTAQEKGIYIIGGGGWNFHNNVVLLDNAADGHSPIISGIDVGTTGTNQVYHNSVKVYGTATSGSASSAALTVSANSITTVKNNIWQNLRTGGSGVHYACNISNVSGTKVFDYNYLETSTSPLARWSATTCNAISNWRTSSGASVNEISGTITLTNMKGHSSSSAIQNAGTNLLGIVPDDKEGNARDATPWIGAWEVVSPLPVELIEFSAVLKGDSCVNVLWVTASEKNNMKFTIEKSKNFSSFTAFAEVPGAGNSTSILAYNYIDKFPYEGTSYYRLKQTDFDGKENYSDIIAINNLHRSENDLLIYPNPNVGEVIYFKTAASSGTQMMNVMIYRVDGACLITKDLTLFAGEAEFKIGNYIQVIPGSYFIVTNLNGKSKSGKLIILPP